MQRRQTDRRLYFDELAATSEKYFMPYISAFAQPRKGITYRHSHNLGKGL